MKKVSWSLFAVAVALGLAAAPRARADDGGRVIEDELVLQDPTVAATKDWVVGGSIEGWYVTGPYNQTQNGATTAYGTINGTMPGGNLFLGWSNLTLQYSHREGKFDINETYTGTKAQTDNTEKQFETEITARYLFKVSKHFNPYVLVGYNDTNVTENDAITTPGFHWPYNGKTVLADQTHYSSVLFGGGAIVPFNQKVGVRGDLRILSTSGKWVRNDGLTTTGSGAGVAGTLTGYLNVLNGFNVQAGFKGQTLEAGNDVPNFFRFGLFGSLGYSYKF